MTASQPDNEAIFHAARAIPDSDRRREYVRAACGSDEARVAHIEALLAAVDSPDSLLDRPTCWDPAAAIDRPATDSPGAVIGPYTLVQQIGEGGMGTVFLAEQTHPVQRKVALKLIKAGMDTRQVIARFEAERQALALMDHPNIARVLDAGTTDAGRPYFVMDLVKGVPITRYCDERHLTPRQRLELVIPVCLAVQHAHQKGIIHRDIKPSNVLIAQYDGVPVPKIIDFGVAKATGPRLTERTLHTEFGSVVGTLEYMSPEQAELNQLDIDTRSDIYSLGVLLYELLTGTTPLRREHLERAGLFEVLRIIREDEPPRPSTRLSTTEELPSIAAQRGVEPRRLSGILRGELDWIVMKALEKDRNRRYESASGLAADLLHYLADEPVQACPPSAAYRFHKFARRNRVALATAVTVGLAVLLAVIVLAVSYVRIRRETRAKETALVEKGEALSNARAQRRKAEESLYPLAIAQANSELAVGDLDRVRAVLAETPERLRGWEWGYLSRHARGPLVTLRGHKGGVTALALSPDGRLAATADESGMILLWDPDDGRVVHALTGHEGKVLALAFRPDGRRLASAGLDHTARLWDPDGGHLMRTLRRHTGAVRCLAYSPDGARIATGGWDNTALVWDADTGAEVQSFGPLPGCVEGVSFAPAGRHLAASWTRYSPNAPSREGGFIAWQVETGRRVLERSDLRGGASIVWDFVPAAKPGDPTVRDPATGAVVGALSNRLVMAHRPGPGGRIAGGAVAWDTPIAPRVPATETPGEITLTTTRQSKVALHGHTAWVTSIGFLTDGRRLVSASLDGTARVWDADPDLDPPDPALAGLPDRSEAVAPSPDGRLVASIGGGQLRVWEARSGRLVFVARVRTNQAPPVFSPDGRCLIAADAEGVPARWELASGRVVTRYQSTGGSSGLVRASPDGRLVARVTPAEVTRIDGRAIPRGGSVLVFDAATGEVRNRLAGFRETVNELAFSPDLRRLAAAGGRPDRVGSEHDTPGEVKVWDLKTGRLEYDLGGHGSNVFCLAFRPDGVKLATGSSDRTVRVWDLTTARMERVLTGHFGYVDHLAYSPDGSSLASRAWDGTSRLWDPATGRERLRLRGQDRPRHSSPVHHLFAFSPDGRRLASVLDHRTVPTSPGRVTIFDVADGRALLSLVGHLGAVTDLAFSPDGARLITGDYLGTVRVWEGATSESPGPASPPGPAPEPVHGRDGPGRTLWGHNGRVVDLAFLPGGRLLSFGSDREAIVWDSGSGRPRVRRPARGYCQETTFDAAARRVIVGDRIYVGGSDGLVWSGPVEGVLADPAPTRPIASDNRDRDQGAVKALAVDPARGRVAVSYELGWSRLYRAALHEWSFTPGKTFRDTALAFSHDGRCLFSAKGPELAAWNLATLSAVRPAKTFAEHITSVAPNPDGSSLALTFQDGRLRVLDAATFTERWSREGRHPGALRAVAFAPEGRRVAVGTADGHVLVLDQADGRERAAWWIHTAAVEKLLFDPSGRTIASAGADGTVELLDAPTISTARDELPSDVFAR